MVQLEYLCICSVLYSTYSSSSLGHSPDQHSVRRQCYSGKRVCDDMYSNSSERTDSDPKSCVDWSRRRPHWDKEHHHGLQADLRPCDYQVPDAAISAVIRGRAVLLYGSYQHFKVEDIFTEINIQTHQCYKYIAWLVYIRKYSCDFYVKV